MQSGRPEKLWGASLISAALGLVAFGALELVRRAVVRRYGAVIAQAEPVRRPKSRLRSGLADLIAAVVVGGVLVTAWFVWIEAADVSPLVVPRPSRVWRDISDSPGVYWSATWATLQTAAAAFAIGVAIGMVIAVLAARSRIFAGAAVPVIVLMAATPLVALLPLFARVLGYNPSTVRLLAATMVFFPVFVYTRSGLAATRGSSVDVVHALGATAGSRFRLLTLPGAVPHIVSGCRLAAGSSIVAAVVGESLIGTRGLGVEFSRAYRQLDLARAFGAPRAISVALRALAHADGHGEIEGQIALLQEAVALMTASEARLELCRAQLELGTVLRRARRRSDAGRVLGDALELARACGARRVEVRVLEELEVGGTRMQRAARRGADALSPSERRVVGLAIEGLTNRQIAEALFVTLKAVEWHLGNAYRKLDVRSRHELPGALAE